MVSYAQSNYFFENVQADANISYSDAAYKTSSTLKYYLTIDDLGLWEEGSSVPEGNYNPDSLEYLGAFRLPTTVSDATISGLTFYPEGNNGEGSLFSLGNTGLTQGRFYEWDIPELIVSSSKSLNDLNFAETLKYKYIEELSLLPEENNGILYHKQQKTLYFGGNRDSYGDETNPTLCRIDTSFNVWKGPWHMKDLLASEISPYMLFEIPQEWADKYTNGMTMVSGRGYQTQNATHGVKNGPSLHAISPWKENSSLEAGSILQRHVTLLDYGNVTDRESIEGYMQTNKFTYGGFWLNADKSLIITGIRSYGVSWYEHSCLADFRRGVLIFYDIRDFEKVIEGNLESYQTQPYAFLDISKYFFTQYKYKIRKSGSGKVPGCTYFSGNQPLGTAYDKERDIVYILEDGADHNSFDYYNKPIVHAFKLNSNSYTDPESEIVNSFYLFQNKPNPFCYYTEIKYKIPSTALVDLSLYDIFGKKVAILVNEEKSEGVYTYEFSGNKLSQGIYFCTLKADNNLMTRKILVIK